MLLFTRNIIQLILAPTKGWEDISACGTPVHQLMNVGLYPMISAAALSVFAQLFYHSDTNIAVLIVMSLVVFVSFFITYFFAKVVFKTVFHHYCDGIPNEKKYSTVILYSVCLLSLSTIICNLMPVKLGLEYILPLAVALILWKSDIYLAVRPDKNFLFALFGLATVVVPPILVQALFSKLL